MFIITNHFEVKTTYILGNWCRNGCQTFHKKDADIIYKQFKVPMGMRNTVNDLFSSNDIDWKRELNALISNNNIHAIRFLITVCDDEKFLNEVFDTYLKQDPINTGPDSSYYTIMDALKHKFNMTFIQIRLYDLYFQSHNKFKKDVIICLNVSNPAFCLYVAQNEKDIKYLNYLAESMSKCYVVKKDVFLFEESLKILSTSKSHVAKMIATELLGRIKK